MEALTPTDRAAPSRIPGIDLARTLAVIGMFAVHVSPHGTTGVLSYVLAVPRGRSAILFGLLAGVGVSLLARSRSRSPTQARTILLWRAAVLLPLGLALQPLEHNVLVILADYAVLFVLAVVVVRWPDRWLLALAAASASFGSVGYLYGRIEFPGLFVRQPAELGLSIGDNLHALVLSGPYPLITWTAPFCIGIWLGRRDLAAPVVRRRLVLMGGALAIVVPAMSWGLMTAVGDADAGVGWWELLDDTPHSQMPLWLVSATASAAAVLGISLVLGDRLPRILRPLITSGRMAFTWYVAHVLVLHFDEGLLRTGTIPGTYAVIALFVMVMVAGSALWLAAFPRGPLEYLLQPTWRERRQRSVAVPRSSGRSEPPSSSA